MASCASARDQIPPSARRHLCVQPTWTRSKECHRCAAAAGKFARFTCGYNRLVTPSWALFFVKTPFRSSRASSNMACSRKIVFTLAPTGVSVLRTAACIARFTRCPRRPTTCQKEVEVKSPFIIQYHRAMSAKSQMVRQGQRSQFGDPRASLTHLTAQLSFLDSVHGVHAAKSVRLSVQGVTCWLGTEHCDRTLLHFGGALTVNTQSLLRRGSSFLKSIQCQMFLVLFDFSFKENQVMT